MTQIPNNPSSPTVTGSRRLATDLTASNTPGMKDTRSLVS